MNCENCENEHDGTYGSGRFCSTKCARGFSTKAKRKEINERVSKSLQGRVVGGVPGRRTGKARPNPPRECRQCGAIFKSRRLRTKCCSRSCSASWRYNPDNPDYERNIEIQRKAGRASAAVQAANRRSKNEICFAEYCEAHFDNVLTNEQMFNGWDADVILPDLKVAILWNGKWHYEEIMEGTSLKQIQNRDRIKLKEIRKAGYEPYVIKDMGKHNPQFVKEQFETFLSHVKTE